MIPVASTTVALLVPSADDWGGAGSVWTTVGTGIRAHLSALSGAASSAQEGQGSAVTHRLLCDPAAVTPDMRVLDETTGETYQVDWVQAKPRPLGHVAAGLHRASATS